MYKVKGLPAFIIPLWVLPTATSTAEGLVTLHNFIFYTFLTAVLVFVLLAIALLVLDSYDSVKGFKFTRNYLLKNLGYLAKIQEILEDKSAQQKLVEQAKLNLIYSNFVKNRESISNRFVLITTNKLVHGTVLEVIWTMIPSAILIMIAIPSFSLLYSMDEVVLPDHVVRVIGHQWYWSYETVGTVNKEFHTNFDSYMIADRDLHNKSLRLLETDTSLLLPINTHLRLLFTSSDVLHSWTVPFLGIKVDAVPGRLSQFNTYIECHSKQLPSREVGVELYGQCSEICGVNHGFMPISVILV